MLNYFPGNEMVLAESKSSLHLAIYPLEYYFKEIKNNNKNTQFENNATATNTTPYIYMLKRVVDVK